MGIENYGHFRTWPIWTPTHYPSWGSKTSIQSLSAGCSVTSLPLMGIENDGGGPECWPPMHVSLPLMGIENAYTPGFIVETGPSHYPSWGSKTT